MPDCNILRTSSFLRNNIAIGARQVLNSAASYLYFIATILPCKIWLWITKAGTSLIGHLLCLSAHLNALICLRKY